MKHTISILAASAVLGSTQAAMAQTEVEFWHAFTGRLGELVAEQVDTFNNSQSDYTVVATHKGTYSETLNAGIAAFEKAYNENDTAFCGNCYTDKCHVTVNGGAGESIPCCRCAVLNRMTRASTVASCWQRPLSWQTRVIAYWPWLGAISRISPLN